MVLTNNDLQIMIDKFIDLLNDKYKDNPDWKKMDYYKLEKPVLLDFSNVDNEIIDDNEITESSDSIKDNETESNDLIKDNKTYDKKPDLPNHFSLYKEKGEWYLTYSKVIDTFRYNKKIKLNCMCIQTEVNRLINKINKIYPNLQLPNYIVQNPYDFIDKTPLKENNKPVMPLNFSIFNMNSIDYIQFSKKINDKKVSYKRVIKSYDLQSELNNFVDYLNKEYKLDIAEQKIIDMNNWKTINEIKI
jgi:hypothetical protein